MWNELLAANIYEENVDVNTIIANPKEFLQLNNIKNIDINSREFLIALALHEENVKNCVKNKDVNGFLNELNKLGLFSSKFDSEIKSIIELSFERELSRYSNLTDVSTEIVVTPLSVTLVVLAGVIAVVSAYVYVVIETEVYIGVGGDDGVAVIDYSCISCGACIDTCPTQAIGNDGMGQYAVICSECIGCGSCIATCPVNAIYMDDYGCRQQGEQTELLNKTLDINKLHKYKIANAFSKSQYTKQIPSLKLVDMLGDDEFSREATYRIVLDEIDKIALAIEEIDAYKQLANITPDELRTLLMSNFEKIITGKL